MTPTALLSDLQSRGIVLAVANGKLTFDAPAGAITPELRERLRAARAEIMTLLSAPMTPFIFPLGHWPPKVRGLAYRLPPEQRADALASYFAEVADLERQGIKSDAAEQAAFDQWQWYGLARGLVKGATDGK